MRISLILILPWVAAAAFGDATAEPVYADNVVIVLDGSGSMREDMRTGNLTKLAAAQQALHQVLAQLPQTTHVGVLAFSTASKKDWLVPLGPQDPAQIKSAIDGLKANGGTPLARYMKIGADRLLEQRQNQYGYGTYRLLVVTDGEAEHARTVNRYTADIIARGITVDVIGVNMKKDHTLATRVHSYRRADDPAALRTAIAEVFAEVASTNASDDADTETFATIAPLPNEIATAMLQALATSGNEPIGTQRAADSAATSTPPSGTGTAPLPANTRSSNGVSALIGSPICCLGIGVIIIGVLVIVIGVLAFVFMKKGRR
jgi:hypothetical protein